MRFVTSEVERRHPDIPRVGIRDQDDGDPLQLKGARVFLTRGSSEPAGLVLGTTTDYGRDREMRAFVKLSGGCTAWFPIDDLEPADEVLESTPLHPAASVIVPMGGDEERDLD